MADKFSIAYVKKGYNGAGKWIRLKTGVSGGTMAIFGRVVIGQCWDLGVEGRGWIPAMVRVMSGGEGGIRTREAGHPAYALSRRAYSSTLAPLREPTETNPLGLALNSMQPWGF